MNLSKSNTENSTDILYKLGGTTMNQWEYVGVLVGGWKILDWTSISAFPEGISKVKQGLHFSDAVKYIGLEGWEMSGVEPLSDGDKRFWFKRIIQS